MKTIERMTDIDQLDGGNGAGRGRLCELLREMFRGLQAGLEGACGGSGTAEGAAGVDRGSGREEFSLEAFGPIFVLGRQDDLRDLRGAFLADGLFETVPEEVAELRLARRVLYRIMVACNNEFMPVFLVPREVLAGYPESRRYLEAWL